VLASPEVAPAVSIAGGPSGRSGRFAGGGMADYGGAGYSTGPTTDPKYDPVFRAAVNKAKNIHCYAGPRSFHVAPILTVDQFGPDLMWTAQVSLWIQQDVVDAVAALNASALQKTQADASVEQSPVKRIETVRVWGYQLAGGLLPFPVDSEAQGGLAPPTGPSFTGKISDDQFDVVRFTVALVVDQRELLHAVDAIGKQNFYKCTNPEFVAMTPENTPPGYLYGTAPCVRATIDFEGYLARAVYKPLMPKEILAKLSGEKSDQTP
jgi:hypothetical protein